MESSWTEILFGIIYDYMMPLMTVFFFLGIAARIIIYFTVKCEWWFAVEFEHRVEKFMLETARRRDVDFHDLTKELLDKTHYEFYLLKKQRRLRRFDYPMTLLERFFNVVKASERIIEDTLKQTRYVKSADEPDFDRMAKYVFASNPYYNRFLGIISKNTIDDLLNVFPNLMIVCGILGTFVGIIGGIPDLRMLDITNIGSTNIRLNEFLDNMGFALVTSTLGMLLSLVMTVLNTALSPYATYVDVIELYKNSLGFIWQECQSGEKAERRGKDRKDFVANQANQAATSKGGKTKTA